ncbi:hypothetical protein BgAZ_208670 [Babesia gibsoni]|uniref:Uncharacterized protein n=1 Tax=Babesia gibsoni TaxID=33632 RepID=A0AAD8PEQ2_BABGI|nr:hypothetical protein BgAZ_208670 [Babesia gibsoni]
MRANIRSRTCTALYAACVLLFYPLAFAECGDVPVEQVLKRVDIKGDQTGVKTLFDATIIPEDLKYNDLPFCAKLVTAVWLSEDEVNQATNTDVLFDQLRRKFVARVDSAEVAFGFKKLSALAYLASQGRVRVKENNIQNESKNVVLFKRLPTASVDMQAWMDMAATDDDFSFTVTEGACSEPEDTELTVIDEGQNTARFMQLVFQGPPEEQPVAAEAEQAGEDAEAAAGEAAEAPVQAEVAGTGETQGEGEAEKPVEDNKTEVTGVGETQGETEVEKQVEDNKSEISDAGETEGQTKPEEETPEDPEKELEKKTERMMEELNKTKEQQTGAPKLTARKPLKPFRVLTPEEETEFMDKVIKIDEENVQNDDTIYTVRIKLVAHVISLFRKSHKDVESYNTVLLTGKEYRLCEQRSYMFCAHAITRKLKLRFEHPDIKGFAKGRFVSLLHALMLHGNIQLEFHEENEEGYPELVGYIPNYLTLFSNFHAWQQLVGGAQSHDGRLKLGFDFTEEEEKSKFNMGAYVNLGMGYSEIKYEHKFLESFPELNLDEDLYRKYTTERHFNIDEPKRPYNRRRHVNKKPQTREEIRKMVKSYEMRLLQIPKDIKGYRILYDDISPYPDLQRVWRKVLVGMKLIKEDGNLETFFDEKVFTYEEMRDFFNQTYSMIAQEYYEDFKDFYDSFGVTKEGVGNGIEFIQNTYKAYTGVSMSKLPPFIKKMSHECPVKELIVSLTTDEAVDRMQIVLSDIIHRHAKNTLVDNDYYLAAFCSAAGVFVQNWAHIQKFMHYNVYGNPWATLITSFSKMGQHHLEKEETRAEFKELINSRAAQICRKYISQAGDVAVTEDTMVYPRGIALSLHGAIANLLNVKLDGQVSRIVTAMEDYFYDVNKNGRVGNALGVCLSLQILDRFHNCFNAEGSNDYFIHRLEQSAYPGSKILAEFMSLNKEFEGKGEISEFILKACDPHDRIVEEVITKLMKVFSIEGGEVVRHILSTRGFTFPTVDKNHQLVETKSEYNIAGDEYVELQDGDDLTKVLAGAQDRFDKDQPGSFLDIGRGVLDDVDHHGRLIKDGKLLTHIKGNIDHDLLKQKRVIESDITPYRSVIEQFIQHCLRHPKQAKTIEMEFRILDKHDKFKPLKINVVPFHFHPDEAHYISHMNTLQYIRMLMRKMEYRMMEARKHVPAGDLMQHARALSNVKDKRAVDINVSRNIVHKNYQVNMYKRLLSVLGDLDSNGFYLEDIQGGEYRPHELPVMTTTFLLDDKAKAGRLIFQVIEPVHLPFIDELIKD